LIYANESSPLIKQKKLGRNGNWQNDLKSPVARPDLDSPTNGTRQNNMGGAGAIAKVDEFTAHHQSASRGQPDALLSERGSKFKNWSACEYQQ